MKRTIIVRIGLVLLLGLVLWWVQQHRQPVGSSTPAQSHETTPTHPQPTSSTSQAPDYVLKVLAYVKKNGQAPEGFVGGRTFENRENRLPKQDAQGKKIKYREWDVHPKMQGQNRGPERLITGSDPSAWYTSDHYKTFVRLE